MTSATRCLFFVSLVMLCTPCLSGQDDEKRKEPDPRLTHLVALADELEVRVLRDNDETVEAKRYDQPLLRYTNPLYEAQSDGALFLWVDREVPVALASYSIRHERSVFQELVSVSEQPLTCQAGGKLLWNPNTSGFARRSFPKAAAPRENPRLRLTQMRRLAGRFSAPELRLLPTPLYRYASPEAKVIDGALFALVKANDPEILLWIEAHAGPEDGGEPEWKFALARMRAPPLTVQLDGDDVFTVEGYWRNRRANSDPYVERMDGNLPEDLAIGNSENTPP